MSVEIERLSELRLATVRHVGPYEEVGDAFGQLGALAGPAGLFTQPGAVMIGVYHDDPRTTPREQLRADAAVSVPADVKLPVGLTEQHVDGGTYAKYTHIGPFDGLPGAWERFMDELPGSGHTPGGGPALEFYRSDMQSTPPEKLQTDLYVPLARGD